MYKELIMPTEISIKDKKTVVKGNVYRAALFARTQVIDVITAENERYYFIFYKNSLVYGDKLDKVEEGSFIHQAFHEGIVIEAPHPLLKSFIPNQSVSIPNKNKLFSQLQSHYSLHEIAHITTTLDSFFEKEELIKIIDKIYFHYKRNGNFLKSFQVIQILSNFAPSLKSANERRNSKEFNSYHDLYNTSSLPSILEKDPLFVEIHCFQNRSNPDIRLFLEDILKKHNRVMELLLLWLDLPKKELIETYTGIALQFVTMKDWIFVLGELNINPFRELSEAKSTIEKMIEEGNAETAALCLLSYIHDLPTSYDAILTKLWEGISADFVGLHLDKFTFMFQQLVREGHFKEFEQKACQLAVILFKENDLKLVHEKLLPIQELLPHSAVIRKVNRMMELLEDPDRMMELGDYYAEFQQYDKAIDCFSWEMELQSHDPAPVLKICKMYQLKGMVKEAAAYQKVHNQLKSNQEIG